MDFCRIEIVFYRLIEDCKNIFSGAVFRVFKRGLVELSKHLADHGRGHRELLGGNDLIKEALIARRDLPVRVMEKLITIVSEEAAILINRRHDLPVNVAVDLATRARERASLDVIDEQLPGRDLMRLVERIHDEGRLTPSLLIRAAGLGRMELLQYALAQLSGVIPAKAALMIHDSGPFGLKALCAKAELTASQTKLIRAACAIYRDLEISGIQYDHIYFQNLMIERMLTLPLTIPESEQNWFLERLSALEAA